MPTQLRRFLCIRGVLDALLTRADDAINDLVEERRKLPRRPCPGDEDYCDRRRRENDQRVLGGGLALFGAVTPVQCSNKTAQHGYLLP